MSSDSHSKRVPRMPKQDLNSPRLIKEVQKHPIIWDFHRPDHMDRNRVSHAFTEVAKAFYSSSAAECSAHWAKLKKRRADHKNRRAAKERSGAPATSGRPFKYDKEMSFLDAVAFEGPGESNINLSSADEEESASAMERSVEQEAQRYDRQQEWFHQKNFFSSSPLQLPKTLGGMESKIDKNNGCTSPNMSITETSEIDDPKPKITQKLQSSQMKKHTRKKSATLQSIDETSETDNYCDKSTKKMKLKHTRSFTSIADSDTDISKDHGNQADKYSGCISPNMSITETSEVDDPKPKTTQKTNALPKHLQKKIDKQKLFHERRLAVQQRLANNVRNARRGHLIQSKCKAGQGESRHAVCDCGSCKLIEKALLQQLASLERNDEIGFFWMAMAARLRQLPFPVAYQVMLQFMIAMNAEEDIIRV